MINERPKVLHVVERMGGGLADAMISYARTAEGFDHHLLYARSNDASFSSDDLGAYVTATELSGGHASRIRQVRKLARALGAEIVHGHSAFGGLYARLALPRHRAAIAYTPHSFPFERLSSSALVRAFYYGVEWILARNTTVFIACSRREENLARRLNPGAQVTFVTNVARVPNNFELAREPFTAGESQPLMVVGAGRVMSQKGPSAFAEIARRISADSEAPATEFIWIGDGSDEELKQELVDAGVEITGWLDRGDVLNLMSSASLYVHTALWEGFPIVLLESVAVGTPIAVIDRPYAAGLPREAVLPHGYAHVRLRDLLSSTAERKAALRATQQAFEGNTPSNQGAQLRNAYREALSR